MKLAKFSLYIFAGSLVLLGLFFVITIFYIFVKGDVKYSENQISVSSPIVLSDTVKDILRLPKNEDIDKPIKMLFLGDLMLDRNVRHLISKNGLDSLFLELGNTGLLDNYDLISANLEGAVTNSGLHYAPITTNDFAFSPDIINNLGNYNFNFYNISNNHLTDQGTRGVNETRDNLDKLGIKYSGCRDGMISDCSSTIINIDKKRIGMVGFSLVYSSFDVDKASELLKELSEKTDIIIVNIHWGEEYKSQFNSNQQNIGRAIIDSGADLIIGHHPHVVQGVEIYKEKPIFYSLGNFVFDQYFSKETQEGLAVSFTLERDNFYYEIIPLNSNQSRPNVATSEDKSAILKKMLSESIIEPELIELLTAGKSRIPASEI